MASCTALPLPGPSRTGSSAICGTNGCLTSRPRASARGVRAAGREWVCLALNRILDPDDITTVSSVPPMTDEFEACVEETMDFNPEDYSKCRYRLQCTFARLVDRNNRYLDAMVAAFNDIVDHIPLKFLVE